MEGKGWHEPPDASGKAPEHRDAKLRAQAKGANNTPHIKTRESREPSSFMDKTIMTRKNSDRYVSRFHKRCYICGRKVDLRMKWSYELSYDITKYIVNKEYHYICSEECRNKFMGYYLRSADEQQVQKRMQTEKFKQDLSRFLSQLDKKNSDTTIPEFRRWIKEDLMDFERRSPREQIEEKLHYETGIGVEGTAFESIKKFLENWLTKNTKEPKESPVWYHGTTEDRYRKILADGEIKVSTAETSQHKDYTHDIGTVSLAKHKGMAHFFSAISGMGKQTQIILHIDTHKLDQSAMKKRALFATDAEILYHKNIPASAIIKAETVYVARKQEEA